MSLEDTLGREGLVLRPAANEDGEAIRELVATVLAEFGLEFDPTGTDSDLFDIELGYFARGGIFEIIEDAGGRLLGTCALFPVDDGTVELRKMYLLPEIRGLGFGRELLTKAMSTARILGYRNIYLETARVLTAAVKLYESFGFEPVDLVHSGRCDQAYVLRLTDHEST